MLGRAFRAFSLVRARAVEASRQIAVVAQQSKAVLREAVLLQPVVDPRSAKGSIYSNDLASMCGTVAMSMVDRQKCRSDLAAAFARATVGSQRLRSQCVAFRLRSLRQSLQMSLSPRTLPSGNSRPMLFLRAARPLPALLWMRLLISRRARCEVSLVRQVVLTIVGASSAFMRRFVQSRSLNGARTTQVPVVPAGRGTPVLISQFAAAVRASWHAAFSINYRTSVNRVSARRSGEHSFWSRPVTAWPRALDGLSGSLSENTELIARQGAVA